MQQRKIYKLVCVFSIMDEIKKEVANNEKEIKAVEPSLPELVDRLEKANAESRELLAKHEQLVARRLIGGGTDATPQPEKKEETAAEYAQRIIRGGK